MKKSNKKKIESLNVFKILGLPTLKWYVLSKQNFEKEIKDFIKENTIDKYMIRTDGKETFSPSILNIRSESNISEKVKELFNKKYSVFIMEPGNIYKNFHSLNILMSDKKTILEIVGPGFIATDLNRNGYLHETIEITKDDKATQTFLIDDNKYQQQREKKMIGFSKGDLEKQHSYLLEYPKYLPLTTQELEYIQAHIDSLREIKKHLEGKPGEDILISMGFLDLGNGYNEPIFWDAYCIK